MVKGEMKPLYGGKYSKINELVWICENCGKEFTVFQAYDIATEHEANCINNSKV